MRPEPVSGVHDMNFGTQCTPGPVRPTERKATGLRTANRKDAW